MNSGQVCIAVKRIYVEQTIYNDFLAAFTKCVKELKIGDGFEDNVSVGPLQNKMQFLKAQTFFSDVRSQNLNVALDGGVDKVASGLYISPMVVDRPPDTSDIVQEEPFGELRFDSGQVS